MANVPVGHSNVQSVEHKKASNRIRAGPLVLSVAMGSVVFFLIASSYFGGQKQPGSNQVTFLCHDSRSNQTFGISVDVNLTDGIDRDEAVAIAAQVYSNVFENRGTHELRSASMAENGVWTVDFDRWYEIPRPGCTTPQGRAVIHVVDGFVINPSDKTVEFMN